MAEKDAATTTFDHNKITSAGAPIRENFSSKSANSNGAADAATVEKEKPAGSDANNGAETPEAKLARGQAAEAAAAEKNKLPDLSDEQLKELFKQKGIDGFENFDKLKEKIAKADAPASAEPTAEEKAAQEKAFDKRMLDLHIEQGGSPEQFVALKQIASMDLKSLSIATIRKEMKDSGLDFTDDQINGIIKERYYQINLDELVKEEEEADEDFKKKKDFITKKATLGSKQLENHSLHIKKNAEETLKDLRDAIAEKDAAELSEKQFSSKVDEFSKKVPRKITFELGEVLGQKLDPVTYDVADSDVTEVTNFLKNKAEREKFFFNEDGTLNLSNVFEMFLVKKYSPSAAKASFLEGGNRQVEILKKTFPGTAFDVGVGGATANANNKKGTPGKLVSAGKPERVQQNK